MPTYAELSADLLKDAAAFFKTLAAESEPIRIEMTQNAAIYESMAELIATQPTGKAQDGQTYAVLVGKLLRESAKFFRATANKSELIREQMEQNAAIYEQIASGIEKDPLGVLD